MLPCMPPSFPSLLSSSGSRSHISSVFPSGHSGFSGSCCSLPLHFPCLLRRISQACLTLSARQSTHAFSTAMTPSFHQMDNALQRTCLLLRTLNHLCS